MKDAIEYRGVDQLNFAKITADTDLAYTCEVPKQLSRIAEIQKTTSTASKTSYYDNIPAIVIAAEGADELTIVVSVLDLETLAKITGKTFDILTGTFIDNGVPTADYFAITYRTKDTKNNYRYVSRLKCKILPPDEASKSQNDSTDSTNQTLKVTCISTNHSFTKTGEPAKSITSDSSYDKLNFTQYFNAIQTPDTLAALIKTV